MGNTTGTTETDAGDLKPRKNGAFQISREPLGDLPLPDPTAHKFETSRDCIPDEPAASPAYEDLGELPQSYGENTLFLIARDPHWLFAYWDVNFSPFAAGARDGKFHLRIRHEDGAEEMATEIHPDARNWYVPVKQAGVTYYAEIGCFDADGRWSSIVTSVPASAPRDQFSESSAADFATVPIHITFQRLVEMVRNRMREGESLISALSRLQGEGRRLLFEPGRAPEWSEEQRQVLAALFGHEVMERINMGSGSIDDLLRQELLEKLSTESASELVAKGRLAELVSQESSLFSAFSGALGAAGSGSLFSAFAASAANIETSSSLFSAYVAGALGLGLGAGGFSSETSSWFSALASSWTSAASGSWGGAVGSSWSAQPFGEAPSREFFFHVNAEVIFYGGTHPDAKVWIDGKQIELTPDGSFRYHFRFPDADHSISIVAESPDGVEQRSATLKLERATARSGEVGHTEQPGHLTHPMGRK